MKLKRLHIYETYDEAAPLKGELEFGSPRGEIKLTIKPEHLEGILQIVADALVASANEAANEITAQVIAAASAGKLLT